jgi:hypothetical protein
MTGTMTPAVASRMARFDVFGFDAPSFEGPPFEGPPFEGPPFEEPAGASAEVSSAI